MNSRMLPIIFLVACGAPATTYVTAGAGPTSRSVSVTGTVRIELAPDEACIELTLSARNEAISASHRELMADVSALLEALSDDDALRVERGAIRYSPTYNNTRSGDPRRIVGHVATAQINVRTQDFERIPDVVAQAATRGLDRVDVVFYSTELIAQKAALRRQALEVAHDKANEMATVLGTSIGEVMSIREGGASTNAPSALANIRVNEVVPRAPDFTPSLPPQPGSIPLSISVDVVYALGESLGS
ncbi:MAG: hypothetical protein ACI9KE_000148 [Polyangiales bacterium]|jgi:uncharacterized protein YggE